MQWHYLKPQRFLKLFSNDLFTSFKKSPLPNPLPQEMGEGTKDKDAFFAPLSHFLWERGWGRGHGLSMFSNLGKKPHHLSSSERINTIT